MSQRLSLFARLLVLLSVLVPCTSAHAGGLYLLDRGARALGRGGAFIAAPDDPSALWYNPAGLGESKRQLIMDAVLPILLADYTRQLPDGSYAESIKARPTPIPIPTLAFSHDLGMKHVTIGAGFLAPNVLLMNWERSQNEGRDPAPSRYALVGLKGSLLGSLSAGLSVHDIGPLSIGAALQVPIARFQARTALSACDAVYCAFPEQRDFDAYATSTSFPAYGITGVAGATLNLDAVRFGFSITLPHTLKGDTKVKVKLPTNAIFEEAEVEGDRGSFSMKFPMILRAAGEMRPLPYLRMEGAFVFEKWSAQKSIDFDIKSASIQNVAGGMEYGLQSFKVQRDMKDVWSLRGGAELELPKKWMVVDIDVVLRGGIAYEKGAFDHRNISPITLDTDKFMLSGGLTVGLLSWLRFDAVAGWIWMKNIDSTIEQNQIRQPQAIVTANPREPTNIGAGRYAFDSFFLGGGLRMLFGGATFREPTVKPPKRRRAAAAAAAAQAENEEDTPDAMPVLNKMEDEEEEEAAPEPKKPAASDDAEEEDEEEPAPKRPSLDDEEEE